MGTNRSPSRLCGRRMVLLYNLKRRHCWGSPLSSPNHSSNPLHRVHSATSTRARNNKNLRRKRASMPYNRSFVVILQRISDPLPHRPNRPEHDSSALRTCNTNSEATVQWFNVPVVSVLNKHIKTLGDCRGVTIRPAHAVQEECGG